MKCKSHLHRLGAGAIRVMRGGLTFREWGRRWVYGWFFYASWGVVLAQVPVFPVYQVQLKNGDRLTGSMLLEDGEQMVLKTSLGNIAIPLDQIAARQAVISPAGEAAEPPPAAAAASTNQTTGVFKEGVLEELKLLSKQYEAGELSPATYHRRRSRLLRQATVAGLDPINITRKDEGPVLGEPSMVLPPNLGAPPATPAKPGEAQPKSPGEKKVTKPWSGEALIGTDMAFSTKEHQLFNGRIKAQYKENPLLHSFDYVFSYGKTDGDLSANRMNGSVKTDWDLTRKSYVYNLGGAGYDEIRRIDLRYELGPGLGYRLLETKPFQLSVELGANYQVEDREQSEKVERFYYRLANFASWKVNARLTLDEKFEFFPEVDDVSRYRFRLEANARYLLAGNISFLVTVLDQYDTHPARNVDHNDLQVRSAIGVKF